MGEMYRARDTRLNRTVAIKTLPESLSSNPEARQRFEREARAISSLNLSVVVTRTNYNTKCMHQQTEQLLTEHVLRALVE